MKRIPRPLIIVVAVLILGLVTYNWRFQVEAKLWHWRHGYWFTVMSYDVPVPDGWYVITDEDTRFITLIDTRHPTRPYSFPNFPGATSLVIIDGLFNPFGDLSDMKSAMRGSQRMVKNFEEQTIQIGNETIACEGGTVVAPGAYPNETMVSIECMSTGRLSADFDGPRAGSPQFFQIVSQIRKVN